jgi:hypothetical protein
MSEEEIAAIDEALDRLRREIEEPLRRLEQGIAAGEIEGEAVRRLAHNVRAAFILYDRGR